MKITKIVYKPETIKNKPLKSMKWIGHQVMKITNQGDSVDIKSFTHGLYQLNNSFTLSNKKDLLNEYLTKLASKLMANDNDNLAGIIYSQLIKFNKDNLNLVKDFAMVGFKIAKKLKDPVHIMARCNDLRNIYSILPYANKDMLKILYDEREALTYIVNNYDNVQKKYHTITKEMQPLKNYKILLADLKLEIGKRELIENIPTAKKELADSRELYSEFGYEKKVCEIDNYLKSF